MDILDIPLAEIAFEAWSNLDGNTPLAIAYRNVVRTKPATRWSSSPEYDHAQEELVKTFIRIITHYRRNNPFTNMVIHNVILFARMLECLGLSNLTTFARPDADYFRPRKAAFANVLVREIRVPKSMFRISEHDLYRPYMANVESVLGEVDNPDLVRAGIQGTGLVLPRDNPLFVELENHRSLLALAKLLDEVGFVVNQRRLSTLEASATLRSLPVVSRFDGRIEDLPKMLSPEQNANLVDKMRELVRFYDQTRG